MSEQGKTEPTADEEQAASMASVKTHDTIRKKVTGTSKSKAVRVCEAVCALIVGVTVMVGLVCLTRPLGGRTLATCDAGMNCSNSEHPMHIMNTSEAVEFEDENGYSDSSHILQSANGTRNLVTGRPVLCRFGYVSNDGTWSMSYTFDGHSGAYSSNCYRYATTCDRERGAAQGWARDFIRSQGMPSTTHCYTLKSEPVGSPSGTNDCHQPWPWSAVTCRVTCRANCNYWFMCTDQTVALPDGHRDRPVSFDGKYCVDWRYYGRHVQPN